MQPNVTFGLWWLTMCLSDYWLKIRACSIVILKQVIICPSVWPQVFDKSVSIFVCVCSLSFFLQIFHFSLIWFIFQGKLQRLVVGRWLTLQFFLKCIVYSESIPNYLDQPWAMDSSLIGWQGNLLSASYIQSNMVPTSLKTMTLTVKDKKSNQIKSCLENGLMLYQK